KSGNFCISYWVMDIYSLMANIIITTDDKIRQFLFKIIYVIVEVTHVHKLMIQPVYVSTGWQIKTHYRKSVKIQPQITAFKIHMLYTCSIHNIIGLVLRKYCYTAISFFLSRKKIMIRITCLFYLIDSNLVLCCFYLLKADNIRI